MSEVFPSNVRSLLEERIDSFEKLELVIALRSGGNAMTMDELVDALHCPRDTLRAIVTELVAAKLVERTHRGSVTLAATGAADEAAMAALVELWTHDRGSVARTLSEIAIGRIRRMAERALAGHRRGGGE